MRAMIVRILPALVATLPAVVTVLAAEGAAAQMQCFGPDETRAHVAQQGLIPLNDVVRSARGVSASELVSARLCQEDGMLVYKLAMLARDGRVARLTVDARTGQVINYR